MEVTTEVRPERKEGARYLKSRGKTISDKGGRKYKGPGMKKKWICLPGKS